MSCGLLRTEAFPRRGTETPEGHSWLVVGPGLLPSSPPGPALHHMCNPSAYSATSQGGWGFQPLFWVGRSRLGGESPWGFGRWVPPSACRKTPRAGLGLRKADRSLSPGDCEFLRDKHFFMSIIFSWYSRYRFVHSRDKTMDWIELILCELQINELLEFILYGTYWCLLCPLHPLFLEKANF